MSLGGIAELPATVKLAIAGVVLALVLTGAFLLGGVGVLLICLAGIVLILLLLIAFRLILAQIDKKKSNPFLAGLSANSGTTPQGISDPSRRARLDDLNRAFSAGIERFKSAGKDLYALPWYVVVGEPGSGKTEAIRHSNIGFPPGMQDELQGAGGTLNMNWWFANQAVLLDTAGRLMFEEVQPGETSEWQEFLKLLRSNRATCPINGMFLVLPVDSLIKDTAEQLEGKARRIATQLDSIQRALGVRFPVFVLVTKCDLLNGFRESFEDMGDPRSQHQMLGWSNAAPLDQPFDPSKIDEHFRGVIERLEQRRVGQLADPVSRMGPDARRTDEVDALFAFPESVGSILPRLQRYLELVFVTGEWANKPLFLRGIYFTSSMRDGQALDAQLAEVLGVPVDSLPEGRAWERDRSYFLRDVFAEKAFRERGLVTRADSAEKLKRRRRTAVLGSACAVVAVLLLLTWIGGIGFRRTLGEPKMFWSELARVIEDAEDAQLSVLASDPPRSTNFVSRASEPFQTERFESTLGTATADLLPRMQGSLRVPAMFRIVAAFSADLERERLEAYRSIIDRTWLKPVVEAARQKMQADSDEPWNDAASAALAELLRMETLASEENPLNSRRTQVQLVSLLGFVLSEESQPITDGVLSDAAAAIDFAYADGSGWPSQAIGAATPASRRAVLAGIDRFRSSWSTGGQFDGRAGAFVELVEASSAFRQAEAGLLVDVGLASAETGEEYDAAVALWLGRYDILAEARQRLADAVAAATDQGLDLDADREEVVRAVREEALAGFERSYAILRDQLPRTEASLPGGLPNPLQRRADELVEDGGSRAGLAVEPDDIPGSVQIRIDPELGLIVQRLESAAEAIRTAVEDEIGRAERALAQDTGRVLASSQSALIEDRAFEVRFGMIEAVRDVLATELERGDLAVASLGVVTARERVRGASEEIDRLLVARPDDADFVRIRASLTAALESARRSLQTDAIDGLFEALPESPREIGLEVASRAETLDPIPMPDIPLTMMRGGSFDRRYHPDAANALLRAWETALTATRAPARGEPRQLLDRERVLRRLRSEQAVMDGYLRLYVDYWTRRVPELAGAKAYDSWADFRADLRLLTVFEVIGTLDVYAQRVRVALDALPADLDPGLSRRVQNAREALAGQSSSLSVVAVENLWTSAINSWIELGDDGVRARDRIMALTPTRFRSDYLGAFKGDEGGGSPYFESVVSEGIRVLAGGSQSEAQSAYSRIVRDSRVFPICTGVESQLEPGRLESFAADVRTLVRLQPATDRSGPAADTIGEGDETIYRSVNDLLKRMTTGEVINTPSARTWFEGLEQIAAWLAPGGEGLTAELLILPYTQQVSTAGADRFRHVQVVRGSGAIATTDGVTDIPTDSARAQTGLETIIGAEEGVELRFRTVPGEDFDNVASLDDPWSIVGLVLDPRASIVEDEPGFEGVWKAPVSIVEGSGRRTDYWIGIRFSHPMPDPSVWVDGGAWPRP